MTILNEALATALRTGTEFDASTLTASERAISAGEFADLVAGRGEVARGEIHPRGLTAKSLHITGDVDWSFDRWCAVRLDSCEFDGPVIANGLRVDGELGITKSAVPSLRIVDARIDGDFSLRQCIIGTATNESDASVVDMNSISVNGTLHMQAMTIYGHVDASLIRISFGAGFGGTTLHSGDTWWGLDLHNSEVREVINFTPWHTADEHRFFSAGYVSLVESKIGGLIATGAVLYNPGKQAINAAGAHITGACDLGKTTIEGSVVFNRATLDAGLWMNGATLSQPAPDERVLAANSLTVDASVFLHNLTATGGMSMIGARINGQLSLNGATLTNEGGDALDVFQSTISGGIFMGKGESASGEPQPFTAHGCVGLGEATLASLRATGARFLNPGKWALNAIGAHIAGACDLRDMTIEGTVGFERGTLDAGLWMNGTTLSQPAPNWGVLVGGSLTSAADIFLDNLTATGGVSMNGAMINGQMGLNGSTLTNEGDDALSVFQSTISGGIFMGKGESAGGEPQPFTAYGRVLVDEANLGSLRAFGARFLNPGKWALNAEGTHFTGICDLRNTTIEGSVVFRRATLNNGLSMINSTLSQAASGGAAFDAGGITCDSNIALNNLTAMGGMSMIGARINGQLSLNGATLTNEGGDALDVFQSTISGGIFMGKGESASGELQSFTARGCVLVGEATLASLRADGAHFLNPGKLAIKADGAHITGACDIGNTTIEGTVSFTRATLDAGLSMVGSALSQPAPKWAVLVATSLRSAGGIYLRLKSCVGGINLGAARIQDELVIGGSVEGTIDLSVSQIDKSVGLTGLESHGLIRMETTVIGGSLIIKAGCRFLPAVDSASTEVDPLLPDDTEDDLPEKAALSTDGALVIETCDVDVLKWKRLVVKGRIKFADSDSTAGSPDFTTVGGNMHLDNMEVGEDLNFNFVRFDHVGHLSLNGTKVQKNLQFGFSDKTRPDSIRLRGVTIDELQDEPDFWGLICDDSGKWIAPADTKVDIDLVDFTYLRFGVPRSHSDSSDGTHSGLGTLENVEERLSWLGLQTRKMERDPERQPSYVPQPYQQLADVYRAMGRDGERRQVLITQQDDLRKFGEMTRATKTWNWFMSTFAAHGYRPLRSFGLTMAIFLLSVVCVWIPKHNDAFVASVAPVTHWKVQGNSMDFTEFPKSSHCTSEYPCLNEWLYTLDAVIPVVDLQQTPYWSFDKSFTVGWFFQILFALLTVFGWISTSIFVIVISGIVSKE